MTTETPMDPIAATKQAMLTSKDRLLATFAFVPDDKLNWSPSATARTPLQIAAHCGRANATFATLLRGEPWPHAKTADEAAAQIREADTALGGSRAEVVQRIENTAAEMISALDGATAATLETIIWSPFGEFPYAFCMTFPSEHMAGHARQIDYLQTIWGDREDHS